MEIKFYCPRWGSESIPWPVFSQQARLEGYKGVEVFPLLHRSEKESMLDSLEANGLEFALLHAELKEGKDFKKYLGVLRDNLYVLADYRKQNLVPSFISSQTGREYYTPSQVEECLGICDEVESNTGIPIYQETHRNKWSYAAHIVKEYLLRLPSLKLTLDLSHWVCVSESFLQDQQDTVDLAIQHTFHLHARVGHPEGPQVIDPGSPENAEALFHHLKWWEKWINALSAKGVQSCTITPEFGPYPYLPFFPHTEKPIVDQWDINRWMKNLLQEKFGGAQ